MKNAQEVASLVKSITGKDAVRRRIESLKALGFTYKYEIPAYGRVGDIHELKNGLRAVQIAPAHSGRCANGYFVSYSLVVEVNED